MGKRKENFLSEVKSELIQIRQRAEVIESKKKKNTQPFDEEQQKSVIKEDLTKIGVVNWLNQLKNSKQIKFFNDLGRNTAAFVYIGELDPRDHFIDDDLRFTHEGVFLRVGLTRSYTNDISEVFIGVKKENDIETSPYPYSVGLYEFSYPEYGERDYRPSNCAKFNSLMGERSGYSHYGVERGLINLVSIYERNMELIDQGKSPQFDQPEFVRFHSEPAFE
jgi:hypothetical protein